MGRMNIYVSDDLHRRIRKAPHRNWSEVAQSAFEIELAAPVTAKGSFAQRLERLERIFAAASKRRGLALVCDALAAVAADPRA